MRGQGRTVRARVGRNIRTLRRLRGWSQEQLAERAGSSPKNLGRVERGEVNIGLDGLADLAGALSVNVSDLFAESSGRAGRSAVQMILTDDVAQLAAWVRRIKAAGVRGPRGSSR